MTIRRNLIAGMASILVLVPLPIFARSHVYRAEPILSDPAAVLIDEDSIGPPEAENSPSVSAEKSGTIATKDGRCLRLNMELGNVRVLTDGSGKISYHAVAEADSRDPGAKEFLKGFRFTARRMPWGVSLDGKVPWQGLQGRFSATIEIHIPRQYSVEIHTGGGNIDVQDIDGRVSLTSAGGNIAVGRVGGNSWEVAAPSGHDAAPAEKDDSPKPVLPVAAGVETQGGQITVGNVTGSLRASTAGGHITTGDITGDAILRTGGGQIYAGRITGAATLDTGGGNIRLQAAGSSVAADVAGGTVVLRQADAPLRVSANNGSIIAWLSDQQVSKTAAGPGAQKNAGPSQLSSTDGDIVLYIPRQLAATIDATIEVGNGHRIAADPSLPVQITYHDFPDGVRAIHCAGRLNGGGQLIHVKTISGNIILRVGEPETESKAAFSAGDQMPSGASSTIVEAANSPQISDDGDFSDTDGFFAEMRRRILESWWGGIPVDAAEMQKHLERSVAPVYPEVARKAGIEGDVVLRVYVSTSGTVTDLKVLDGPPILARAAVEAVRRWQYQAPRIDGRPANVVTTIVVSFRLH